MKSVNQIIEESISIKQKIKNSKALMDAVVNVSSLLVDCYRAGNKVLLCGNGGSAADAQHIAAELSGKFLYDRDPLYAEALHVNSSYLTAVANDYSFHEVFARLVKAMGENGDVLIGLSTSGNSTNVVKAFEAAKNKEMKTVAFTGELGGQLKQLADICINIPSVKTPRIQENHIFIAHIICEYVENELFPQKKST